MFQAADGGDPESRTSSAQESRSADELHWKRQHVRTNQSDRTVTVAVMSCIDHLLY